MDERGLATGIFKFIVALAFFGLIYGIFNQFAADLTGQYAVSHSNSDLDSFQTYVDAAWTYLPVFVVLMLAARLLARAAFESRGGV